MNIALWIIQILLALLFLFAGGTKLVMPIAEMTKEMPIALPGLFLRFIGVCEVVGGLGLVLPGLLRTKTWLTPVAALGLVVIMLGAIAFSLKVSAPTAIFPLVTALLLAFVAYGRWRAVPTS